MTSWSGDPIPWLLAAVAFLAVGAMIAALLAVARLGPLVAGDDAAGTGEGRREPGDRGRAARTAAAGPTR